MKKAQFITFATERGFNFATAKARVQAYICGSTDLAVVLEDGVRNSRRVTFHITNKAAYAMRDRFNRWIAAEAARLADVAATVADESQYAETVMAEEADVNEAEAMQIAFFAGNDYAARRDLVELAHSEALAMDTEAESVEVIATKAGLFDLWERIDAYNCRDLVNNLEMHYVAAYNDECAGGDATTAPQRLFGFNAGDTLRDVFRAVVGQAEEDLAILVDAAHAEALAIDAQKARNWSAFAGRNVFDTLSNADHRRKAIDAAHVEALAMNEERDRATVRDAVRHYVADEMAREFIAEPEAPAKAKRVTRVKLLSTVGLADGTNERTYRIDLDNGRTYFYSDRCQVLQVRHKSRKQANRLVEIKSPYILRRVQDAIARFQA